MSPRLVLCLSPRRWHRGSGFAALIEKALPVVQNLQSRCLVFDRIHDAVTVAMAGGRSFI
jgi:hypothetical protein